MLWKALWFIAFFGYFLFIYLLGEFVQLTKTVIKVYTNKKKIEIKEIQKYKYKKNEYVQYKLKFTLRKKNQVKNVKQP